MEILHTNCLAYNLVFICRPGIVDRSDGVILFACSLLPIACSLYGAMVLCDTCHDGGVLSVACMELHPCVIRVIIVDVCLYPVCSHTPV